MYVIDYMTSMDDLDKEILNEIQWSFPLVTRPFDAIAKKFDTTPEIIKDRLHKSKRNWCLKTTQCYI